MRDEEATALLRELQGWLISDGKLVRETTMSDFRQALNALIRIGDVAEREGHHPDMTLFSWNRVRIELYTHSIGGLSENDFILAAKIDPLLNDTRRTR